MMDDMENREHTWILGKLFLFFLLGLVAGILFVNVSYHYRSSEVDIFGYYLVDQLKNHHIISKEYLMYLIPYRGRFWLASMIIGMSRYAKYFVLLCVVISGFLAGSLSCAILVQQGMKAMVFITLANFPQCICYSIASILLFVWIDQQKETVSLKNKAAIKSYAGIAGWSFVIYVVGIVSEAYINPYILDLLTKCLQI